MEAKRKRLTERGTIDVLCAQGVVIPCPCPSCTKARRLYGLGHWITNGDQAIREHLHQRGTGGGEEMGNFQYWYFECSHKKTHGTKATSAGSDAHARAKIRRLTGKNKPKPKRKIQSRGFQKRKKP